MIALQAHKDLLDQVPLDRAKSILFYSFQDLVLTTKHPGFGEEEEWRIIHSPFMFSSAYVMPSIHTIGGLPQVVHKIELKNQPNLNAPELELDNLLPRVIVAPCQYPNNVAFALQAAPPTASDTNIRGRLSMS